MLVEIKTFYWLNLENKSYLYPIKQTGQLQIRHTQHSQANGGCRDKQPSERDPSGGETMSCELVRYKLAHADPCVTVVHYPNVMCYCTMHEAIIMTMTISFMLIMA